MLDLGHSGDKTVPIDIGALVETHGAIVANPGGGKSYSVRKILELAAGGPQRIVLDVEDEFYTLREASPSLIIAGGANGDCPADPKNAAALARFLLETGADAVIQINDLGLAGQRHFVTQFLESMISAPTALWHPALIVLDEVQRLAPEGSPAESSDAVVNLLMQGRKRGFGALIATQRLARVSKNVTGAVNNWLLGRAGQSIDRRAVAEMLGVSPSSDEAKGLPRLHPGTFWGFGPAIGVEPLLIKVDAAHTTHLRAGQRDVPTPPAPEQIQAMLAKLHVEAAPSDEAPKSNAAEFAAAERRGYERGLAENQAQLSEMTRDRDQLSTALDGAVATVDQVEAIAMGFLTGSPRDRDGPKVAEAMREVARGHPARRAAILAQEASGDPPGAQPQVLYAAQLGDSALPTSATKMLAILARGVRLTWVQTATLAGLKARGGSFNTGRKALRDGGYVVEDGNGIMASSEGIEAAGGAQPQPSTPAELLAWWRAALPTTPARVLAQLCRQDGKWVKKDRLAEFLGVQPRGGSWNTAISMLRRNDLIEIKDDQMRPSTSLR